MRACAQIKDLIPNFQLVAAGSGDAIAGYQDLAQKLGLAGQVDFPGFVSDTDLPKYYAGAHVFVLPTTTAAEGFGMVLLEAEACGTAVIGSNTGGIPHAIAPGAGELVAPGSVEELAAALKRILTDDTYAHQLGTTGAKAVTASFSWKHQATKFAAIIKSLTQNR
jgi:glycosyltransferase involved in cell wall biosynthesis